MKARIHITNPNHKKPRILVKKENTSLYCKEVVIKGDCRVVSGDTEVWIETEGEVICLKPEKTEPKATQIPIPFGEWKV